MHLTCTSTPIDRLDVDTVSVSLFSDERPLRGSTGLVDWRLCGRLSRMILKGEMTGAFGEKLLVHAGNRLPAHRVLVTGIGDTGEYSYDRLTRTLKETSKTLAGMKVASVAITLPGVGLAGLDYPMASERLLESFIPLVRRREWLDQLTVFVVVHKSREREVARQLEKTAANYSWARMEGRRFRCE